MPLSFRRRRRPDRHRQWYFTLGSSGVRWSTHWSPRRWQLWRGSNAQSTPSSRLTHSRWRRGRRVARATLGHARCGGGPTAAPAAAARGPGRAVRRGVPARARVIPVGAPRPVQQCPRRRHPPAAAADTAADAPPADAAAAGPAAATGRAAASPASHGCGAAAAAAGGGGSISSRGYSSCQRRRQRSSSCCCGGCFWGPHGSRHDPSCHGYCCPPCGLRGAACSRPPASGAPRAGRPQDVPRQHHGPRRRGAAKGGAS